MSSPRAPASRSSSVQRQPAIGRTVTVSCATRARLQETGFADVDLAKSTERAAQRARESGDDARAVAAFSIASAQWGALGRDQDAARVDAAALGDA